MFGKASFPPKYVVYWYIWCICCLFWLLESACL